MKVFITWIGKKAINGIVSGIFFMLAVFGVTYALNYPSTPPYEEIAGGKFMANFNKIFNALSFSGTNVGIGTATPGKKLDIQGGDVRIGVSGLNSEFCLNGNCITAIPDKQKGDILFHVDARIYGNQIGSTYGANENDRVTNLMVAAWHKGVERVGADLGWSSTKINDTKNAYTTIEQMRTSIATGGVEWGTTLIGGYLLPGLKDLGYGEYVKEIGACVGSPIVMWCSEGYACAYETFHPGVHAFSIISCISK